MAYKRLLTDISIRIILLVCTLLVLVYFWAGNRDPLILLNLLLLVILQVYLFIRSQNRVNRKLRLFFEALKFDELGLTAGEDFKDPSFRELHETMKGIMEKSRQMNLENQQQKNYFKAVTEHAGVGILAFDDNLEIRLVNHTCMDLLGIREVSSLGDLEKVKGGLSGQLKEIRAGQQKLLRISLQNPADITGETQMQLSVRAAEIKLEEERIKLLSFQNI